MKKPILYFSSIFALLFVLSACSGEEVLIPSDVPFVDPFIIPANKTDQESVLRRGFYERTGVHLILRDEVGETLDADGNPYIEMIDLKWNFTEDGYVQTYEILTPEQQPKAVEILEKNIIHHLCGPNSTLFSVYPVANYYDKWGDTYQIFSTIRCTLVNMNEVLKAKTDEETAEAILTILYRIGDKMVNDLSSEFRQPFYDFSKEYHGKYISKEAPDWVENQDMKYLYKYGFVSYYKDYYGDTKYDEFPTSYNDFMSFVEFVLKNSEEKIRRDFADYPLVITKYELMRSIIEKAGYIF